MGNVLSAMRGGGVAVVGAGGAGDVVSAYVMCEVLKDLFGVVRCVPVAVPWERWSLDPFPGPIPADAFTDARFHAGCVWVSGSTRVRRPGYVFRPQASAVAEVLGSEVPAVPLDRGVDSYVECLEGLASLGYGLTMMLDVGGDILARGWEPSLWSPLIDSLSVAAALRAGGEGVETVTAVLAPGADGELSGEYVMRRIAEVARRGGFLGVIGLLKHHLRIYERILPKTRTEAGLAAYHALKGEMGVKTIRGGTRQVEITPATPAAYLMKTETVAEITILPNAILKAKTIEEANEKAHQLGITTELDLELTAAKLHGTGTTNIPDWKKIKEKATTNLKTRKP